MSTIANTDKSNKIKDQTVYCNKKSNNTDVIKEYLVAEVIMSDHY